MALYDNLETAQSLVPERYGSHVVLLDRHEIEALLAGQCYAWEDGEYSYFLAMRPEDYEPDTRGVHNGC